jgi:hypothetical protein
MTDGRQLDGQGIAPVDQPINHFEIALLDVIPEG